MALEDEQIKRLNTIYLKAEGKIEKAIKKINPKSPFRKTRKEFLGVVRSVSKETLAATDEWTKDVVDQNYVAGSKVISSQIKKSKNIAKVFTTFSIVDKEAVESLVFDVNFKFAETMQAVNRSSQRYLNDYRKSRIVDEIAADIVSGRGIRQAKRDIIKQIEKEGFTAFTDRGGRRWSLSRYSEMLARTTIIRSRNEGAKIRLLQNGARYAKISRHAHEEDVCTQYEGKIVDLLDPQIPLPPYHPNCKHVLQYVDPIEVKPENLVE